MNNKYVPLIWGLMSGFISLMIIIYFDGFLGIIIASIFGFAAYVSVKSFFVLSESEINSIIFETDKKRKNK